MSHDGLVLSALAFLLTTAPSPWPDHRGPMPVVATRPAVARLNQDAYIDVHMADPTAALEVKLDGATDAQGRPLPWRPLRFRAGLWTVLLPRPSLSGVYPIELRKRAGSTVMRSQNWLFRVYAAGTLDRPSFKTPELVARWWVRAIAHAHLVGLKRWPRPAFDHRVRQLHQLVVVAYGRPSMPGLRDRLGIWITAVRNRYAGNWRLLEATVAP